ncbi:MAG: beta-ketoacyl synthase N-terminal-like domain-containing protein [Acidobacteriota bacterium]|nr:beta-ketoacyl synthase N-terminal-like domain-containing protein [Acidobacteriota bacterium]
MNTHIPHEASDEIAIIGMAGRFPGAADLETFWRNLRDGVESIGRFSEAELLDSGFPPEMIRRPDFVAAKGILEGADLFDAAFFGLSPREAELMDPQHRLLMECAWQALEDAGYDSEREQGRIAAFTSTGLNTYLPFNICSHPGLAFSVGGFHLSICNDKDFVATRIAYAMNLTGASVNVSTACSSSLVSLHFACQSLLAHQCDTALVGAVTVHFPQKAGHVYETGAAYSPDGHCRPFDATPSGLVDGSGVAAVVLKRLDEAIAAGDRICAVIKGTAVNNDGRNKVGYTAPSVAGQAAVIAEALAMAGVAPDTISYVEAHGTATPLGDPIEVAALTQALRSVTPRQARCGLGSVKSNIGHADTAAGLAGLLKVVLGLQHRQLAPTLHFQKPNPDLQLDDSPFYVVGALTDWPRDSRHPRRAGISSFGVGGTNAHAIVEEAPEPTVGSSSRRHQLLMLSARTPAALQDAVAGLARHLDTHPDVNLADAAYTLQVGRRAFNRRAVVPVSSREDAIAALADPRRVRLGSAGGAGVAFMFPGQGSQHPGMARDLYDHEPSFRADVDTCAEQLQPAIGLDLRRLLFPDAGATETAAAELRQTAIAQPAIFVIEYALAKLWMRWGVQPSAMIGHSIGEYVAACLAGVFTLKDALTVVATRGRLMQGMPEGAMLAVLLPEAEVAQLAPELEIAAVNAPSLCVVSGPLDLVAQFEALLTERHVAHHRLHTSHAFHSSMMEPVLAPLVDALRRIRLSTPTVPVISNRTGGWLSAEDAVRPEYWAGQLRHTVRFADGLACLLRDHAATLLEVGPGGTLTGLAKQIGAEPRVRCLTSLPHASDARDSQQSVLAALAELWLSGVPIDWPAYYEHERRLRVPLPTYPFQRQRYWIEPRKPDAAAFSPEPSSPGAAIAAHEPDMAPSAHDPLQRHDRPNLDSEYAAPRNAEESAVAEIWQEVLGIRQVGIHDNFFDLGGHSLLGTQVLARLRQDLGANLELTALFENQTIAGLTAAWLDQAVDGDDHGAVAQLLDRLDRMTDEQAEALLAETPPTPRNRP